MHHIADDFSSFFPYELLTSLKITNQTQLTCWLTERLLGIFLHKVRSHSWMNFLAFPWNWLFRKSSKKLKTLEWPCGVWFKRFESIPNFNYLFKRTVFIRCYNIFRGLKLNVKIGKITIALLPKLSYLRMYE